MDLARWKSRPIPTAMMGVLVLGTLGSWISCMGHGSDLTQSAEPRMHVLAARRPMAAESSGKAMAAAPPAKEAAKSAPAPVAAAPAAPAPAKAEPAPVKAETPAPPDKPVAE